MHVRRTLVPLTLFALAVGGVYAADQTILGKSLTVKNPSTPDRRKVVVAGKEVGSPNSIVGDPTGLTGSATLTISVSGGSPSSQAFVLDQGVSSTGKQFWT